MSRPPRLADRLLRRCLPRTAVGESIRGDLAEEYGRIRSRWRILWYWWHALVLAAGYVSARRGRGDRRQRKAGVGGLGQDLLYALRLQRRRPGLAVLSVTTLALGIGAASAIYSVVDRVLIRALPYPAPHELVTVWNTYPAWRDHEVLSRLWDRIHLSYPEYVDWRDGQRTFESVAVYTSGPATLTGNGDPALIGFGAASASLFPMLGTQPALGRFIRPDEQGAGGSRIAVISHAMWTQRFGRARSAMGASLTIDGESYEIVGVLPRGFRLNVLSSAGRSTPDVWVPAGMFGDAADRGWHLYEAIGRLRPGVTLQQAAADVEPLLRGERDPSRQSARVIGRQAEEVEAARGPLLLLLACAGILMLIAIVNVATLHTAGATERRHELATRSALGARRGRLVQQLLIESALIGALGAALGLCAASVFKRALLAWAPQQLTLPDSVPLHTGVLAATMLLGLGAGVFFGAGPALIGTRRASGVLSHQRSTAVATSARLQRLLVGGESALCVVLLVVSLLLVRSLVATQTVDPGFRAERLIAVQLPLSGPATQEHEVRRIARRLVSEAGALPGVTAVTGASAVPFSGLGGSSSFTIEGRPVGADDKQPEAHRRSVLPGFHETLDIPVLSGRAVSSADTETAQKVVVVSDAFAKQYWPNESPLGGILIRDNARWEIVGVVGDVLHADLTAQPQSTFYFPFLQQPPAQFWLVVRTAGSAEDLVEGLRRIVGDAAPTAALGRVERMTTLVDQSTAVARYRAMLVTAFAGSALLLAAVGVFGVTARTVASRRRELGIRIALGATHGGVMSAVVRREFTTVMIGVVIGLGIAALIARGLEGMLFGVPTHDIVAFTGAATALTLVGLAASYFPARRVTCVTPVEALRVE